MPYWQYNQQFGPSPRMQRPTLQWVHRSLRKTYRRRRGDLKYNRAKWMWCPRHVLLRRAPMRTEMINRHFMRQMNLCRALIRPPHLRRPARRALL